MTGAQAWLLRQREQRDANQREVDDARRDARAAEDRARRAEADASRALSEGARSASSPFWGYGPPVIVRSRR